MVLKLLGFDEKSLNMMSNSVVMMWVDDNEILGFEYAMLHEIWGFRIGMKGIFVQLLLSFVKTAFVQVQLIDILVQSIAQ